MKLCTDHLQTHTFFYHWTPHHSTDRYHQFFPMDKTPHCYTNTLFMTFFTEKCKPMTSNLGAPTKDLPVQFYTKGMKDRLIKMTYHPPPHRILLKFPMCSCRPHIFWLTIFLLSFSLPCPHPFAPFVTMPKAKLKTTAHTECADHAARIHKCSNQVSLEEELNQISAANAVGHSKMKKQSKARTAFNAQTMATKAKLKKTPGPNDSMKDKDSCLDGSIKKFLFCKVTMPTFSTLEASKLKKVCHNGTTPDKKTPSLNPKATDFTPIALWPWEWIPLFTSHHHKSHQPLCCFCEWWGGDKTKVTW